MAAFEVNGVEYSSRPLDAFAQMHCSRRIAPVVKSAPSLIGGMGAFGEDGKWRLAVGNLTEMLTACGPLLDAISGLKDEDVEFVIKRCLAVTSRRSGVGFAPVWAEGSGLMFSDIGMPEMIQISYQVLSEALGPFFGGLVSKFSEKAA